MLAISSVEAATLIGVQRPSVVAEGVRDPARVARIRRTCRAPSPGMDVLRPDATTLGRKDAHLNTATKTGVAGKPAPTEDKPVA